MEMEQYFEQWNQELGQLMTKEKIADVTIQLQSLQIKFDRVELYEGYINDKYVRKKEDVEFELETHAISAFQNLHATADIFSQVINKIHNPNLFNRVRDVSFHEVHQKLKATYSSSNFKFVEIMTDLKESGYWTFLNMLVNTEKHREILQFEYIEEDLFLILFKGSEKIEEKLTEEEAETIISSFENTTEIEVQDRESTKSYLMDLPPKVNVRKSLEEVRFYLLQSFGLIGIEFLKSENIHNK